MQKDSAIFMEAVGQIISTTAGFSVENEPQAFLMKGFPHEVLFVRRIFTNKDGSIGLLNLVCSDLTCNGEQVATIYQKRWKVEEFHKSLKSNTGLAKSPTRTVTTQNNHVFMSIYAVFKLECLKIKHKVNHFALRTKLFLKANKIAYEELRKLQAA